MHLHSLRNKLAVRHIETTHECALVLSVEGDLKTYVEAERRRFATDELLRRQLDPHITLLYGGFQLPAVLAQLEKLAERFEGVEVDVELTGLGTFSNRSGFITNVHYALRSDQLRELHLNAVSGFENLGLSLQSPYVRAHYVPHLSIFDRIVLPRNISTMIALPTARKWCAGGCHLVGEPR